MLYFVLGSLLCWAIALGPVALSAHYGTRLNPADQTSLLILTGVSLPLGLMAWAILLVVMGVAAFC